MKSQSKALILALLLLTFSTSISYGKSNQIRRGRLRIIGTVVAYDYLAPLFSITSSENSENLIVRVEGRSGKREKSRYIKVRYIFWPDESANNDIDDGTRKWRFTLLRERRCDGTLKEV